MWNFGDGGNGAAGDSVTRVFTRPGTYTVTATVRDQPGGAVDTDTVVITVTGTSGSAAPPAVAAPPSSSPQGDVGGEQVSRPRIRAPKTQNVRKVLKRGLRLRVTCEEECRARSVLRLSGERVGASKRLQIDAGETRTVVVRFKRSVRRNLLAAMRQAGVKRILVTAITTVATDDLSRAYPVRVRLKR